MQVMYMNYVENEISLNDQIRLSQRPHNWTFSKYIDCIESQLYRAEKQDYGTSESSALDQLSC